MNHVLSSKLLRFFLLCILLSSCAAAYYEENNPMMDIGRGEIIATTATFMKGDVSQIDSYYPGGYPFYLVGESKVLFLSPTSLSSYDIDSLDSKRVLVNLMIVKNHSYYYVVELLDMKPIETNRIMETSRPDTLSNDKVNLVLAYYTPAHLRAGSFLTFQLEYEKSGSVPHYFHLVSDTTRTPHIEDGYYCLEFKHDANNDTNSGNKHTEYVSFAIPDEYSASEIKGYKIIYKDVNDIIKTVTVSY